MSNDGITKPEPFLASGISLGKPTTDATSIQNVDNVLFLDEQGKLHFRDSYIVTQVDINGNPIETITLEDLWTKNKGVYVKDGKLFFKDSTTNRAYSLSEMVSAFTDTKNRFVQGGIWWIGRTAITNAECENIIVNVNGNPNNPINDDGARLFTKNNNGEYPLNAQGTRVFSIDQYINDTDFGTTGFRRTETGEKRWHDIPSLQILIPAVDENKITTIISKLSIRTIKNTTPIMFRLYDETTDNVLDTTAVGNNSLDPVEQQPLLTFTGRLTTFNEKFEKLNCQCPTEEQKESAQEEPPHIIKVQFYVDEVLQDDIFQQDCVTDGNVTQIGDTNVILYSATERRLFGFPNSLTSEPITNSSIDCVIYDVSKEDKIGRKSGTVDFNNNDIYVIKFNRPFSSTDYSVAISCNKNINMFYTNKRKDGFTIRSEKKFTGSVDWIATKLKFEGNA